MFKEGIGSIERNRYITPEEFNTLLNAAKKNKDELSYHAFFACGNLGLRVSELVALVKSDFDFTNSLVRINTLKQRKDTVHHLKVNPGVMDRIKKYASKMKPEDKLFNVSKRQMQRLFDRYANAAKIKIQGKGKNKGRGIHCLRHLRGIVLASKTRDPYLIAKALRHKNLSTSMAYVHMSDYDKTIDSIDVME